MKELNKIILLTLIISCLTTSSKSQGFKWIQDISSGTCFINDSLENCYITGGFNSAIYLAKYNKKAEKVWEKSFGDSFFDVSNAIDIDRFGNIYLTGSFGNAINFDTIQLVASSQGYHEIFVIKLDAYGNVRWAVSCGGNNYDYGFDIETDELSNIYISGWNEGEANFGDIIIQAGAFIAKYDSSGNILWAKHIENARRANSLTVYEDNIFVTGNADISIFITKFDTYGNRIWIKNFGSSGEGYGYNWSNNIECDIEGNIYITGYYKDTLIIGSERLASVKDLWGGTNDVFLMKFNNDGELIWAKSAGGEGMDVGNSIAIDTSFNVYLTGYYGYNPNSVSKNAYFDTIQLPTPTGTFYQDLFVAQYDKDGKVNWVFTFGGEGQDEGYDIQVNSSMNPIIIYKNGSVYKFGEIADPVIVSNFFDSQFNYSLIPYPNPLLNDLYLKINTDIKIKAIKIYNIYGSLVLAENLYSMQTPVNLSKLADGTYILEVKLDNNEIIITKLIKY